MIDADERDELAALAAQIEALALACGPAGAALPHALLGELRAATAELEATEC